jgi:hypothetical protein
VDVDGRPLPTLLPTDDEGDTAYTLKQGAADAPFDNVFVVRDASPFGSDALLGRVVIDEQLADFIRQAIAQARTRGCAAMDPSQRPSFLLAQLLPATIDDDPEPVDAPQPDQSFPADRDWMAAFFSHKTQTIGLLVRRRRVSDGQAQGRFPWPRLYVVAQTDADAAACQVWVAAHRLQRQRQHLAYTGEHVDAVAKAAATHGLPSHETRVRRGLYELLGTVTSHALACEDEMAVVTRLGSAEPSVSVAQRRCNDFLRHVLGPDLNRRAAVVAVAQGIAGADDLRDMCLTLNCERPRGRTEAYPLLTRFDDWAHAPDAMRRPLLLLGVGLVAHRRNGGGGSGADLAWLMTRVSFRNHVTAKAAWEAVVAFQAAASTTDDTLTLAVVFAPQTHAVGPHLFVQTYPFDSVAADAVSPTVYDWMRAAVTVPVFSDK